MSALPFDADGADQLAEAARLLPTEQLGRECARRCAASCEAARAAKDAATATDDLVAIADAAQAAADASFWCQRFASCTSSLLGNGDAAAVQLAFTRVKHANTYAELAEKRFRVMKRIHARGANVNA